MRYVVGIICLVTSLLLCACSEDAEKDSERYSATFLDLESYGLLTPEDFFLIYCIMWNLKKKKSVRENL